MPERNGSGTVIDASVLEIVDPELAMGAQTPVQMVYSLTALPRYGYLTLNGLRMQSGDTFSVAIACERILTARKERGIYP